MDNLRIVRRVGLDETSIVRSTVPTFTEESPRTLKVLDQVRILIETEYNRSSRSMKDRLINPLEQVRGAIAVIKQVTEKG